MTRPNHDLPPLHQQVLGLLEGGHAHLDFESAFSDVPDSHWNRAPDTQPHSLWQQLEHMRICQWDLIGFSIDPDHRSPPFPLGYWPDPSVEASESQWQSSLSAFRRDAREFQSLVRNTTDLTADLPHAVGYSVLREALVLADHNAYHLGQVVALRRALGIWPTERQ
ncbi:MAG: DinB family protein [Planctomycetota bacterium]